MTTIYAKKYRSIPVYDGYTDKVLEYQQEYQEYSIDNRCCEKFFVAHAIDRVFKFDSFKPRLYIDKQNSNVEEYDLGYCPYCGDSITIKLTE